jgi:hypothetical protein
MKNFVQNIIKFGVIFIVISGLSTFFYLKICGLSTNNAPSLYLSNSFSLNEKIGFLKNKLDDFENLSIGSSQSLNNINGEVVTQFLKGTYINGAFSGANIEEAYKLLLVLTTKNKPKNLIIAGNIMDFKESEKEIDFDLIDLYLNKDSFLKQIKLFANINVKYFFEKSSNYLAITKKCSKEYNCYEFDEFGIVYVVRVGENRLESPLDSSLYKPIITSIMVFTIFNNGFRHNLINYPI